MRFAVWAVIAVIPSASKNSDESAGILTCINLSPLFSNVWL